MQKETDSIESQSSSWRENWFVKNWLAPIPVIGGFFRTNDIKHALHHAGKSTCMLLGGSALMILDVIPVNQDDLPSEKFGKITASMAIGMTGGVIFYNTLFGLFELGGKAVVNCQEKSPRDNTSDESLQEPLLW